MRELTMEEIEKLATRPGVKKIAVENFLMTVHHNTAVHAALYNLAMDAKLYGWNRATVNAILAGIKLAQTEKLY